MGTKKKKRQAQLQQGSKAKKALRNGMLLLEKHLQQVPQSDYTPVVILQPCAGIQPCLVLYDNGA
jgi:hypothetical protein